MSAQTTARILVITAFVSCVVSSILAAEGDTVINPTTRKETLEAGKALMLARTPATTCKDPFYSVAFAEVLTGVSHGSDTAQAPVGEVRTQVGPRDGRDLLQAIALSLKPSGYIVLGGQPTILFGQKRVKAGGFLTITFEGSEYTLEIVSIDRPNFTLRLNREEFTRPIK